MDRRRVRWAATSAAAAAVLLTIAPGRLGVEARESSAQVAAPWLDQDIGTPAIAGSASDTGSGFNIVAGGTDIWGASDEFHFVYQPVSGDVDVRARVDGVTNTSTWAKAGVMIRSALTPDAAHGFTLVSAASGTAFQRRVQTAGSSTRTAGVFVAAPQWVRLVRKGTTVSSYTSADGSVWTLVASDTIQLAATAYVGLAVTSQNASAATTATISQIAVVPLGLPSGQQNRDIGAPALAGSVNYSNGTYQIHAAGTDIAGSSDQFHYIYQPVSGDVDVAVRIASVSLAHRLSQGGVMIRETLRADSAHALAFVSAGRGDGFQRRPTAGGTSLNTRVPGRPPGWVRLKRAGALITAYTSNDGQKWTVIGSDSFTMADTVYVGIAATSHNATAATDVVADHFTLLQAAGADLPPLVSIVSPASGATFTAPASVAINATASDPENQLAKVEFYNGAALLGTATAPPYALTWPSVTAGTYSLTAIAYDAGGLSTRSSAVNVVVSGANQAPTVALTAPAGGASYLAPATISLGASAADADGTVARVDFYAGTTLIASATTAPYAATWSAVPAGTYSLTAVAYDSGGLTTRSAPVSVTVNTVLSTPTGTVFTASADQDMVTSYRLDIFVLGSDPNAATPLATLNVGKPTPDANNDIAVSAPTLFSGLAAGTYQLTVTAISSSGSSRSAPVSFTR